MIRRRRKVREIEFSFDSFLDVVANVVGIILRLILVAWVGARSYKVIVPALPPPALTQEEIAELPDPQDPLSPEVERERRELAQTQARLLEQLKEWQKLRQDSTLTAEELARLTSHAREVEGEKKGLEEKSKQESHSVQVVALSLAEIRQRSQHVIAEIEALRKAPPLKQTLRYRTPVSHPLQSEELLFECRRGRVALIDIGGFLEDVQRTLQGQGGEALRNTRQYSGVTEPIGPFRLRYALELEGLGSKPDCAWEVEPVTPDRGEALEAALAPGSEFRRIIDSIEPAQTAVTLCVYPDSFALYRKLRDFMHERDIVVAGRPLPEGAGISASRHGTASRGQ
jgi:FtsZ-binding cell division protein ZapB